MCARSQVDIVHYWNCHEGPNFLECQNKTVKKNIVSLDVDIDLQENMYFLSFEVNRQGILMFFLAVSKKLQENHTFT
jgi:hypothetical protein